MKQYDVEGYDRPLLLSEEHAEEIGASEHVETGQPKPSAGKAEWVAYAETRGADPDDAAASTKRQLVELYGE